MHMQRCVRPSLRKNPLSASERRRLFFAEGFEEAEAQKAQEATAAAQNVPQVATETQAKALESKSQATAATEGGGKCLPFCYQPLLRASFRLTNCSLFGYQSPS